MTPKIVAAALVVAGLAAMLLGEPGRAWGAFLFNLLFWAGLAAAAPTLSASIRVCNGRWADDVHRLARAWMPALWLSVLLFLALPLGAEAVWPWAREPVEGLEGWLSPPSVFARDGVALLLLAFVAGRFTRAESARERWAVALILVYAAVMTLLAVDLVMSLEPRWVSTLFGAYVFMSAAYAALASLPLLAAFGGRDLTADTLHDLGKLLFGFCLLWVYLFWSQYLVIWYGNLPRETGYWAARTGPLGWRAMATFVLLTAFVLPFATLLGRANKRQPRRLAAIAAVVLVGLLAERWLLVMPSILPDPGWPLGWAELAVTGAFTALVVLAYGSSPPRLAGLVRAHR